MAYNKHKNQSTTMCKNVQNQKIDRNCILLTSGVNSHGFFQGFGLWSLRNFHPGRSLEQNMISKLRNAQCCLFLHNKTLYQIRMCMKLIVWAFTLWVTNTPEHYTT